MDRYFSFESHNDWSGLVELYEKGSYLDQQIASIAHVISNGFPCPPFYKQVDINELPAWIQNKIYAAVEKEKKRRLEEKEKSRLEKEEKERKEYERLKKKYGR